MASVTSLRLFYSNQYTSYNPQTSVEYFDSALKVAFNLDPAETANKYSDSVSTMVNDSTKQLSQEFITAQVDKVTSVQKAITEKVQNDPLLWMRLAIDEMNKALLHGEDVDNSRYAINKALALAPKRVELLQLIIQLDGFKKDWAEAVTVTQKIIELSPQNTQARWQLAMAYYLNGQTELAVKAGDEAIAQGMTFNKLQQFAWYIQYYFEDKKDYAKAAPLLEKAINLEPNELGLYIDLAQAYAKLGDFEKARLLAQQVAQTDPTQKAAMDAFIRSLP